MNSAEVATNLIKKVMNLKEWTINRQLPNGFRFKGKIPYDMWIVGTEAEIKVYAQSLEEAEAQIDEWLEQSSKDDSHGY